MRGYNYEETIREWFSGHVARITHLDDEITVIDWSNPKSSKYAVRYLFDRNHIYVSGDLGEAIFTLTEKARLGLFFDFSYAYYFGKLTATSDEEKGLDFDSNEAVDTIRERFSDEELSAEDSKTFSKLQIAALESTDKKEWRQNIHNINTDDSVSRLSANWWEWLPSCGDVYGARFISHLYGLKMMASRLPG